MADRIVKYLEEPKMEKATSTMLVVLVIGALIGAAGAYYYVQPQLTEKYDAGYAAGSAAAPAPASTAKPDIEWTWDGYDAGEAADFDQTGIIDVDGNVAELDESPAEIELTIENTGDADIASLYISLDDPQSTEYGIENDLQVDPFWVYLNLDGVKEISIYKETQYYTYSIGALPIGAKVTITIGIGVMECDDEEFEDVVGEDFTDCMLYAFTSGSIAEEIDFAVHC